MRREYDDLKWYSLARLVNIERIQELRAGEDLFVAKIKVKSVDKSAEPVLDKTLSAYFERPQDGGSDKRCPSYVELKLEQTSRFFVRSRQLPIRESTDSRGSELASSDLEEPLPWLEMGSDVSHTNELSPIVSHPLSGDTTEKAIAAAVKIGADSAVRDIERGDLRILSFGKPRADGKLQMDEKTGYRLQVVGGCIVSEPFVAEVDSYNHAMRQNFAANIKNENR